MKPENRFFDVYPRIFKVGQPASVHIHPLYDHVRFAEGETFEVSIDPMEEIGSNELTSSLVLQPVDGDLVFEYEFPGEQEYLLKIQPPWNEKVKHASEFRLYAVHDDLFALRPYKGDLHMHTYYSDGLESPAFVAAACRRIGLDFIAITDHSRYAPSLEAIQSFTGVATDLRMYPGEEIHPPGNRVHMINFGGRFSINALFDSNEYHKEIGIIEDRISKLPAGHLRRQYASCLWVFDKIREAGGLAILCHPYWVTEHRYNVPEKLISLFFEGQPFDAYEIIGGLYHYEIESNRIQVARYHAEQSRGKRIPIVGSSDSHGCENADLFGWYYTIAFSGSLDLPDLIDSIKSLHSVAVEALPGETVHIHGPFRLVKFAHFLVRDIFPLHDELCQIEGRLMQTYLEGNPSAAASLSDLKGQTSHLFQHLWGKA